MTKEEFESWVKAHAGVKNRPKGSLRWCVATQQAAQTGALQLEYKSDWARPRGCCAKPLGSRQRVTQEVSYTGGGVRLNVI